MKETTAYPLSWPERRPRTHPCTRRHSNFQTSFAKTRDRLIHELQLLGGKDGIFSSNIPRRQDGQPYANLKPTNGDPGVAVYFTRNGKQMCFACDRYLTVDDNLHAITLTIQALRGIARWGTGDMMEAAFRGFAALPEHVPSSEWWKVLGVPVNASRDQVRDAYRSLMKRHHPDMPEGDHERSLQVQQAWETYEKSFE